MNGLFVNEDYSLCSITADNNYTFNIHIANENDGSGIDGTMIIENDTNVSMCIENIDYFGHFDTNKIKWNNGKKWHKINISDDQIRMFKYRPYTPMILMLLYIFINIKDYIAMKIWKYIGQRKSKKEN